MTTETRPRAINRLKSMYALRAVVDEMYKTGLAAKNEGKPVVWCMMDGGFGGPFLNAIGAECVYPENFGTLCAASGKAGPYLERSAEEGFPDHLCGYARNCFGYASQMAELGQIPADAPSGGMPKPVLLMASGMVCDARFKWFQALGKYLDTPVWTLESPRPGMRESLKEGAYERNVAFLVKGLREFAAYLEKLLGKKLDWTRFEADVDSAIELNRIWYQINQLRKARPGPMHSRDFWSSMSGSTLNTTNPQAIIELYRKMYIEVKERADKGISGIGQKEKYRLTFLGLPPWHSLGFFDKLAERGWNFVIEQTYHPPRPIDLSRITDPVEKLVRYRYQSLAYQIESSFNEEEAEQVKKEILQQGFSLRMAVRDVAEYQCDGALLHTLLTCRGTTAPLFLAQNQMLEGSQVPSLVIEGDIVDQTLFNPEEALQKAEAFEEIMDHHKKVRKEKGMGW
jgi:benzoyl-CoA reductase/2-hydroxyglutaryl-CoA dehydratase subunit BcrC/BadD/HgdB